MTGYEGNKTLTPLIAGKTIFQGERPLLVEALSNLPAGKKVVVVNYRKEDVIKSTEGMGVEYVTQPVTNGTGGALLAAQDFIRNVTEEYVIITMGDVPLVRASTYGRLLEGLGRKAMAVLGFSPADPARYGALETEGDRVARITEWEFWKNYPPERKAGLTVFNAGIYAVVRTTLAAYLEKLKKSPHVVEKHRDGRMEKVEEFFITDLVEFMSRDGLHVGFVLAEDEYEVMGVDTPEALMKAQAIYGQGTGG